MEKQIKNFTLSKLIGKGLQGECYAGVDNETSEQVCIKVIQKTFHNTQLVRNEISILREVDHPCIVKFIDEIETETHFYIIQELCKGSELLDVINDSEFLSEASIKKVFRQLIEALEYLHEHDISHGDIKLDNVICDAMFNIKVIDFGFAHKSSEKIFFVGGTYGYAAPEILRKSPFFGRMADMWSLGVCLYAMLVGAMPFDYTDERELSRNVKTANFSIPEEIPAEVADIIRKLLVVNPSSRLTAKQVHSNSWFDSDEQILENLFEEAESDGRNPIEVSIEVFC
jgi:serine/threonine protein kinase